MNSLERMRKTLDRGLPDMVPTFEYAIDKNVARALCAGGTYPDAVEELGLDCITAWEPSTGGYTGKTDMLKPGDKFLDEWGVTRETSGEMSAYPLDENAPVRDKSDLTRLKFPNPNDASRYETLSGYVSRFKGKRMVSYAILDMFELTKCLMGFERFIMSFTEQPALVRETFERTADWVIEAADKAIDAGADMIIDAADVGYKNGVWVQPSLLEDVFIPCLQRVAAAVKARGAYCFYHSHGNIWELLDAIVDTGVDVVHPLAVEDMMDMALAKKIFGRKVVVAGNISTDFLARRSPEQVDELVRLTMDAASGGGGHILMASSSIFSGVVPENYAAMVKAARKYGKYA